MHTIFQIKFENSQIRGSLKNTFLIIDDEKLIRYTLKTHINNISNNLNEYLFEIQEASNCFEALSIMYGFYKDNKFFDFLYVNEFMPYMKGSIMIKLLRQLSNENNFYKMNIISHTAYDSPELKKTLIDHGSDCIINKPVDCQKLSDVIFKLINTF
jgi:CheY-like chemotaxis protein